MQVSEIGFGCGPTGGLMIRASAAERREAVACALDLGINYFDTAPGYGSHVSETHLGEALSQLGARAHVATKVALSIADLDDIGAAIRRSVEGSLERLKLGEIAMIQLHNRVGATRAAKAAFGTGALLASEDVVGPRGVLAAFEELRARGLVRHFGMSAFGGDMAHVANVIDAGSFDVLTAHYSILNRTACSGHALDQEFDYRGVAARAVARGMGTVVLRVLEGGTFTSKASSATSHSASQARAQRLVEVLRAAGVGVAEGAVRFVLANPEIGAVLVGFSDIEQIRAAARYSNQGPLSPTLLALIEET